MRKHTRIVGSLGRLAVHQAALDRPGTSNDVAAGDYGFTYDGNGNVVQVVNVSDYGYGNFHWQAVRTIAVYEYDAYGNVIGPDTNSDGKFDELDAPGHYAGENAMRFSTKYFDRETGLGNWGYRYYSPALGRWVSRDPLEERGGAALFAYALNAPVRRVDPVGKSSRGFGVASDPELCLGRGHPFTNAECKAACDVSFSGKAERKVCYWICSTLKGKTCNQLFSYCMHLGRGRAKSRRAAELCMILYDTLCLGQ